MLITATGWTLEYVDQMSLSRALDLVEFMSRGTTQGNRSQAEQGPTGAMEEITTEGLLAMQNAAGGMAQTMPAELKADIAWAEKMKSKSRRGEQMAY